MRKKIVYNPDFHPALLEQHLKNGWSFYSFAGSSGVRNNTIQRWLHEHEEFRDVYFKYCSGRLRSLKDKFSNQLEVV